MSASASSLDPVAQAVGDPATLLRQWPPDRPVAMVPCGLDADVPRAVLVGEPRHAATLEAEAQDGSCDRIERAADRQRVLDFLECELPDPRVGTGDTDPTSKVVLLGYQLGRRLEPTARRDSRPSATSLPDAWIASLDPSTIRRLVRSSAETGASAAPANSFRLTPLVADHGDDAFAATVAEGVELVHAGDIFQVNLSERFSATLEGRARDLAARVLAGGSARFGGYVELAPDLAVLSLSPELFLHCDREGRVVTRPIKGTRPLGCDLDEFARSSKEASELAMIVDLMRNDLGRVCRSGSVEVTEARRFEAHPTVLHAVAEIRGRLRAEVSPAALLAATFPPGSVTGAPKIRAMQVIETLEPHQRGFYCGSLGSLDCNGDLLLNVAIRTAVLRRVATSPSEIWSVEYFAGCGIVADSDPRAEAAERRTKAEVLDRWSSRGPS